MLLGQRTATMQAVMLRYERLVATGRRPYLRPLMRQLGGELHQLLPEILTAGGAGWTANGSTG